MLSSNPLPCVSRPRRPSHTSGCRLQAVCTGVGHVAAGTRLHEVKSHVSHTAAVGSLGQLKLSRLQHLTGSPKAYVSGYTCLRILEQRPARSQPCRIHTITPRSSTLPGIPPPISGGSHLERRELSCPPALRFTSPPAPTPSFPFFLLPRRNRALLLKAEPSALPRDSVPISMGQELLDIPDVLGTHSRQPSLPSSMARET